MDQATIQILSNGGECAFCDGNKNNYSKKAGYTLNQQKSHHLQHIIPKVIWRRGH